MSQKNALLPIKKSLRPGQNGTKKLAAQYGDRLVCVRYREDSEHKRRITTVELIVDERPLRTPPPKISPETIVFLQQHFGQF